MLSKLALEKSNFRRTEVDTEDALGAGLEGEFGPREGFLRAGDCKNVLIGDFDRGGGSRIFACLRSLRTAFGSGIVPIQGQHQNLHAPAKYGPTVIHIHIFLARECSICILVRAIYSLHGLCFRLLWRRE